MNAIYEFIFLGLTDSTQNSKVPKPIRILIATLISIFFIISITVLGIYVVFAVDQGIFKRLISAFFLLIIAGYYIYLLKAMTKTKKKTLK